MSKVTIVGAGAVGSATAFTIAQKGLGRELVLYDLNEDLAIGQAKDIAHGSMFYPKTEIIGSANLSNTKNSDIVIVTAGPTQKEGETRLDMVSKTKSMFEAMIPPLVEQSPNAIYIIVSNPVDIATYIANKISGISSNKMFGSGTLLDSSRFRYLISEKTGVAVQNVHGYIIGEHGDSEVPLWSLAQISAVPITSYYKDNKEVFDKSARDEIFQGVVNGAYEVIKGKGVTNYAIALSTTHIVEAILGDTNEILPLSHNVSTCYEFGDVCLSTPVIVNRNGIDNSLILPINGEEKEEVQKSAETLRKVLTNIGY